MSTEQVLVTVELAETAPETTQEEEDVGFKVFVGNLSFQTTEDELAQFFEPAGKVLKANIITRGTRSLGYGFVAYETLAEAEKATADLDKKELGGREINVEVAKPKADGEAARNRAAKGEAARGRAVRKGRGRGRGNNSRNRGNWSGPRRFNPRRQSDNERGEEGGDTVAAVATEASNPEGEWNTTRPTDDTWDDAKPPGGWNDTKDAAADQKEPKKRTRSSKRRGGGPRSRRGLRSAAAAKDGGDGEAETGEPSKTTVFVANLPFATDDDALKALFKDFKIKSAHVVKRRSGRSKGFGFVDLVDEEEQKKVLEGMKGVKADDRELIIKVALSEPHVQEKDTTAAAATTATAVVAVTVADGVTVTTADDAVSESANAGDAGDEPAPATADA